jgi:hypothetical protein
VNSTADQVVVTVLQVNKAPVANAGPDQTVDENTLVTLNGAASTDPDGDPLTYQWTAPSGITLNSTTASVTTFTAPEVSVNTNYTFTLVVNDGKVNSTADQVVVTVLQVNKAPVANAGPDQNVYENTVVTLNGTASYDSDGEALTYQWTAPSGIVLSSTSASVTTFMAPDVVANTSYTFTLTVNDGKVNSTADQVVITIQNAKRNPVAYAGPDQIADENTQVTLNGSASYDPEGDPLTYLWTEPSGIKLSSATASITTFIAPEVSVNTNYTFTLVVNDGKYNSTPDQVTVAVRQVNKIPVANAGSDQNVDENTLVTLNGTASFDPDGDLLSYQWIVPQGITLISSTASITTFMAPEVSTLTSYTCTLIVNDGKVNSVADEVIITVRQVNKPPVADAGPDQRVDRNALVTLNGTASYDPDGDPLDYFWTAPPGIILGSATSSVTSFTAPDVKKDTVFQFILMVNDGQLNAVVPDTMKLTVLKGIVSQTIDLHAGWNISSAYVIPPVVDIKDIFMPLMTDGSLLKIQNEVGYSLEDLGILGGWTNKIGDISPTEGYKIKVTRDCQVVLSGNYAVLPFKIPLKAGWNIIGYPRQAEAEAKSVVQALIDRGTLVKVQDETGKSIEDYGILGGWLNNIGNFKPGKGYKIKVNSSDTLILYESYPKSAIVLPEIKPAIHFRFSTVGNGVDHMNINLVDIPDGIEEGDEIAVFDGDLCINSMVIGNQYSVIGNQYSVFGNRYSVPTGRDLRFAPIIGTEKSEIINHKSQITNQNTKIRNPLSAIRNLSVPVSASDCPDCPGFIEGHLIVLKVWKAQTNKEYTIESAILKGTSTFVRHESTFISLKNLKVDGRWTFPSPSFENLAVNGMRFFPNPTDGKVYIQFSKDMPAGTVVSVLNSIGQKVMNQKLYTNPGLVDLTGNVSGIYYIRVKGDSFSKTEKVILK